MLLLLLIFILAATIYILTWKNSRTKRNLPPGPNPILPFFGNLLQLTKYKDYRTYHMFDAVVDKYGPLAYVQAGRLPILIIHDLQIAKEVLNSEVFVDRLYDDLIAERSFGKPLGILFNFGEGWKEVRKFTMKTLRDFGFGKQTSMENVLSDEVSILIETLDKNAMHQEDVCMQQVFTLPVLNILWSMVAGITFSHDDKRIQYLIKVLDGLSRNNPIHPNILELLPFFWRLRTFSSQLAERRKSYKQFQDFFKEVLKERRELGDYKKEPVNFFDVFLAEIDKKKDSDHADNFYFTDEQFVITCFDLFVAGTDSTSKTLEFAILYMILNQRVQKKVQEEIDRVVGKGVKVKLSDKARLPYVEATILEVQRLSNLLPLIFRGADQDTTIAGYQIPKGTMAGVNALSIHGSKVLWEKPEEFLPERFLDSSGSTVINAHKILPFGLGKRVCLGESLARASLFACFASLLQRYSFQPSPNHPIPSTEPFYGFTLAPEKFWVSVTNR